MIHNRVHDGRGFSLKNHNDNATGNSTVPFTLLNGAALAYIGDAVYELAVREYVVKQGKTKVHRLHQAPVKYVAATAQAQVINSWLNQEDFLTQAEIEIFKRGRNHKINTKAKNASMADYSRSTGFEALIGWLHLTNQDERCQKLIDSSIKFINKSEGKYD